MENVVDLNTKMTRDQRKEQINAWGSMNDRKDSYDDDADVLFFKNNFAKRYVTAFQEMQILPKPDGPFGVDIGLYREGKLVGTMDIERSRADGWNPDWPEYYRHISFLSRKEKFLYQHKDLPFTMVYLNHNRTKVLLVGQKALLSRSSKGVRFQNGFGERKREIPYINEEGKHNGTLFGLEFSDKERKLFHTISYK